jgi:hypothetical protein
MGKRIIDKSAPYQGLRTAAALSGLSVQYLREGCRAGKIAHIMAGREYRIYMPALLDVLKDEAMRSVNSR